MNGGISSAVNQAVRGQNFECYAKNGYIFDRVWGTMTIPEAEKCTDALMELAARAHCRNLAVDIQELDWINNLALRRRGIELFHKGTQAYEHVALISRRPAIVYLVEIMARAAGHDVRSFDSEQSAAEWLRGFCR